MRSDRARQRRHVQACNADRVELEDLFHDLDKDGSGALPRHVKMPWLPCHDVHVEACICFLACLTARSFVTCAVWFLGVLFWCTCVCFVID